jgi:hypothetical protein
MQGKIFGIEHIYILCDRSYEKDRYNYLLQWARLNFPPNYFSFLLYCYKDTIHEKDILHYGIKKDTLKPSEISLIINYNKVFEDILDKYQGYPKNTSFLILESDVIPISNWRQHLEYQMNSIHLQENYYFLHIGNGGDNDFTPSKFGYEIKENVEIYQCPSARCTEAMVWSLLGIEKYICFKNKPVILPLDFYFNTLASNNISKRSDIKTWWSHPVCFIQGSTNGIYTTTINDDVIIPNRLKLDKYSVVNVHIDDALVYKKEFFNRVLQNIFVDSVIIYHNIQKPNIMITEDKDCQKCLCIVVSDEKIEQRKNVILQVSKNLLLEKEKIFIPEICYSSELYYLEQLKNKNIYSERYDYWFYIPDNLPKYYQFFANKLRTHKWTNDPFKKCYFSFCIDEYKPYSISDEILKCFLKGSIPIFKGCNILVNELFKKESFINLSNFDFEEECYKKIIDIINDTSKLQDILNINPFKNDEIPDKLKIDDNQFIKCISDKMKNTLSNLN